MTIFVTQALQPFSPRHFTQIILSGMVRAVGHTAPAAGSTLLRGFLKLSPPPLATILS